MILFHAQTTKAESSLNRRVTRYRGDVKRGCKDGEEPQHPLAQQLTPQEKVVWQARSYTIRLLSKANQQRMKSVNKLRSSCGKPTQKSSRASPCLSFWMSQLPKQRGCSSSRLYLKQLQLFSKRETRALNSLMLSAMILILSMRLALRLLAGTATHQLSNRTVRLKHLTITRPKCQVKVHRPSLMRRWSTTIPLKWKILTTQFNIQKDSFKPSTTYPSSPKITPTEVFRHLKLLRVEWPMDRACLTISNWCNFINSLNLRMLQMITKHIHSKCKVYQAIPHWIRWTQQAKPSRTINNKHYKVINNSSSLIKTWSDPSTATRVI